MWPAHCLSSARLVMDPIPLRLMQSNVSVRLPQQILWRQFFLPLERWSRMHSIDSRFFFHFFGALFDEFRIASPQRGSVLIASQAFEESG